MTSRAQRSSSNAITYDMLFSRSEAGGSKLRGLEMDSVTRGSTGNHFWCAESKTSTQKMG